MREDTPPNLELLKVWVNVGYFTIEFDTPPYGLAAGT